MFFKKSTLKIFNFENIWSILFSVTFLTYLNNNNNNNNTVSVSMLVGESFALGHFYGIWVYSYCSQLSSFVDNLFMKITMDSTKSERYLYLTAFSYFICVMSYVLWVIGMQAQFTLFCNFYLNILTSIKKYTNIIKIKNVKSKRIYILVLKDNFFKQGFYQSGFFTYYKSVVWCVHVYE